MNNNFPLVSIIIVSLNRKIDLLHCLESLYSQTYKHYEILLIDNGSKDGSVETVAEKFPNTRVYQTNKNLGTSYTRNAGVNFSKGELIWFLDSDVYLKDQNTLENLVQLIVNDQEIDGVGGEAVINNTGEIIGTKLLKLYPNGLTKGYFNDNQNKDKFSTEVIATCNLFVKKEVIKAVGGFDHFYFFYLEDIDLTLRISRNGYRLFFLNKCSVVHHFSESSRFTNHFAAKKNRIYFVLKNFNLINILILPIYDLFYLINLDNLKRIYKKLFQDNKLNKNFITIAPKKFKIKNIFYTLKAIIITILSILTSYVFIPIFLLKYSFKLRKKLNFLNLIKDKDFTLVNKKINK